MHSFNKGIVVKILIVVNIIVAIGSEIFESGTN